MAHPVPECMVVTPRDLKTSAVKALLSPWGHSRGRLIREGGFFTKSNDKDIDDNFSLFTAYIYRYILRDSTYNLTSQVHKFDAFFIPKKVKNNMQACKWEAK